MRSSRLPLVLALLGAVLGLTFAAASTFDYANHLDRRLHDLHCSIIPGASTTEAGDACRAALYSPYAALMKDEFWGGIPISLFAIGAFSFFAGFALYLAVAGARAPKNAVVFFALVAQTPLLISLLMLYISLTKVGGLCKTCSGIYISSFLLSVAGLWQLRTLKAKKWQESTRTGPPESSAAGALWPVAWLFALGLMTVAPARVYASAVPDHRPYLTQCGQLKETNYPEALLKLPTQSPLKPTLLFEDPLCPTCRVFHTRMVAEGIYERLQITLALFPLDSECNWMLDEPLHPGACVVARAVICGGDRAREVLEWAYDDQDRLAEAGKAGEAQLKQIIQDRYGVGITQCMDSPKTKKILNEHLHFAVDNLVPVSTPQMYLAGQRICDEDTDLGLTYTMKQLAPEVVP
jgi:uncharacterized membrane protein